MAGLADLLSGKKEEKKTGKLEALAEGAGSGFLSIIRGIRQMAGKDTPEDAARRAHYEELLRDPEVSGYFRAGEMAGSLVEPVTTGLMLAAPMVGAPAKGAAAAGSKELLAKLASSPAMQKIIARGATGAAMGGISGGLSEVLAGQDRLTNAATGALTGGIATPAIGAGLDRLTRKPVAAAAKPAQAVPETVGDVAQAAAAKGGVVPDAPQVSNFPEQVERTLGVKLEEKIEQEGFAGNLRLSRFNTAQDVESTMKTLADGISNKRVPMEELMMMVKHEGMSADDLVNEFGEFKLSPKVAAAQAINVKSASDLHQQAKVLSEKLDLMTDEEAADFMVNFGKAQAVQKVTSNLVAETGRALRALQEKPQLFDIDLLGKIADANGGRDGIKNLISMVASSETPQAVADLAAKAENPSLMNKLAYVWTNNLLSGIPTQVRNIVGNTSAMALHVPEKLVQTTLQRTGLAGKRKAGELAPSFKGSIPRVAHLLDSVPDVLNAMGKGFLLQMDNKLDLGPKSPISGPGKLNAALRVAALGELPIRTMSSIDGMFKVLHMRTSLREQAADIAKAAKLKGKDFDKEVSRIISNPTPDMLTKAVNFAEYQTFQSEAGSITKPVLNLLKNHPSLRFVLPFVKTPSNIMKYTLERTPLSLGFKATRKALSSGTQAQRAEAMSRMLVGSGITAFAYELAKNGMITGTGPADKGELATRMATGWKPTSIKLGDTYYPIQGIEPLVTFLGIAADAHELGSHITERERDKLLFEAANIVTQNLTNKTMMMGLSSAVTAAMNSERYGEKFVNQLEGSLIPAWLKNARNEIDNTTREASTFLEVLKDKIPNESSKLPVKYDLWGRPLRKDYIGNAYVSPFIRSEEVDDPVALEAARVRVGIDKPQRKIGGVKLTSEEYSFLTGYSGKMAHKIMQRNLASPVWSRLDDEKKKDIFENAIKTGREMARQKIKQSRPSDFLPPNLKLSPKPLPKMGGISDL
jgi:hypothetical protein